MTDSLATEVEERYSISPEVLFWVSEWVDTCLVNEIMSLKSWLWSVRQLDL